MLRLTIIAVLVITAFLLIRYRANKTLQKSVITTVVFAFLLYVVSIVVTELMH